YYCFL
ncbi:Hypothetical protein EIN_357100, partial [Entamoeba invadens IP1]